MHATELPENLLAATDADSRLVAHILAEGLLDADRLVDGVGLQKMYGDRRPLDGILAELGYLSADELARLRDECVEAEADPIPAPRIPAGPQPIRSPSDVAPAPTPGPKPEAPRSRPPRAMRPGADVALSRWEGLLIHGLAALVVGLGLGAFVLVAGLLYVR